MKRRLIALALLLAAPAGAQAHIVGARLGDFYAGALHPLTDPQDVLLWVALGLLAGTIGAGRARWLIAIFPLGLLAGVSAASLLHLPPPPPALDAGLTLATGLLLAAALRLSAWQISALAVLIGTLRGAANAAGAAPTTDLVLFTAGLVAIGYVVITLSIAAAEAFRGSAPWRVIALRACGSWVAAIGLMMGGFALAR